LAGASNCSADPRFTLDPDNYVITFSTGFPACIPSTQPRSFQDVLDLDNDADTTELLIAQSNTDGSGDLLCPATNRTIAGGQPVDDSRRLAPIQLGDSITAEGNFEIILGTQFLSAHTLGVGKALTTKNDPDQPDYMFLDEVEIDVAGFQNERLRTLIIGYTTLPSDVTIWSLHYDPETNEPHEFPLASTRGCDLAAGAGECTNQGLGGGAATIFKIRHDVDFLAQPTDPKLDPCAHLRAAGFPVCPLGGTLAEQFAILSPVPHEIQARTAHAIANPDLVTLDVNGNQATNGQYLFPLGMNLGGIAVPEFVEINLDQVASPFIFAGIPWNLDRRLSPGGCVDTTGDGVKDCEANPQPLRPFPFSGLDPRTQAGTPFTTYNDPVYTAAQLTFARDRILSFFDPAVGNFNGDLSLLAWPPADPPARIIRPVTPLSFICGAPNDRQLSVARAQFFDTFGSSVNKWLLSGSYGGFGDAITLTIHVGPDTTGPVLAVVAVDRFGFWQFVETNSAVLPDVTGTISIAPSVGTPLLAVPVKFM